MKDQEKTKEQSVNELVELRQRVAELEVADTKRKRAEEEVRRRTAQLEALRQVGLEITAELDLDSLLHSIVSQAVELLGGTAGGLYLYQPDLDVLGRVMTVGPHMGPIGTILRRGEGLSGKVWETGKPLIVDDYRQWEGQAAVCEDYPWTAIVGVPVHWAEKFLGVLNVLTDAPHTFSPADAEMLSLFATQAAIAIRNASLFEGEHEQRELAESLEEAAAVVSSALDPDQVLDRILEQVSRVVPNDATNIMLIEGDQAGVVRWRGYERYGAEELVSTVMFHIPDMPSFQQMMESGEPMVIPDTATYPTWVRVPATEWLRSYAAAPIVVRGEVIGFLNADSATPGFFSQAHAEALRAFSGHAAAAIENARLYAAQQQRAHESGLLLDVANTINSTLDMKGVLSLVAQWAAQACGADRCTILLLDEEGKILTPIMSQLASGMVDKKMWQLFKNMLYPRPLVEVPEAQQVLQEGRPIFVPRALASSLPRCWIEPFNVKSLLVVPMISKGQPIGVMGLDHMEEEKGFTVEQVNLASTIGAQAAIAIDNARLYQEAQREIAERKRTEEALRESEENYRALVEQSLQGLVVIQDFRIVFANTAFAEISGYTVEELLSLSSENVKAMIHPEDQALVWGRFRDRLAGKPLPPRYEYRGIRKDGTVRWLEMFASRIEYGGKPAVQGVIIDVTERKQAEEALRESEERYKTLVRTSPDAVTATDLEGHITYVSQRTLELHGFESVEELLGRSALDLIAPEDHEKAMMNLQKALKEGVVRNAEYTLLREDGTRFTGELSAALTKDAHGKPRAFVATIRDITERKMAERALERRATQLATVGEIGRQIASILELNELLRQMANLLEDAFGYRYVYIFLLDEDSNELVARAGAGPTGRLIEGTRIVVEARSINTFVARTGEPLLANDVSKEPLYLHMEEVADTKSELAVPIRVKDEVIGTLDVQSTELNAFDESDLFTLQALASQAGIAIENARLYEEARQRIGELTGLHEISRAFSSMTDVRETFGELTERMAQLIGCQGCTIATYDHRSREMQAQPPGYGVPDEVVQSFRYKVDGLVRDVWNFRRQGPFLSNDIVQIPDFFSRWLRGFDVFNLLIVPMALEGRITGLVYAANKPGGFAEDDLKLLAIFAGQAGVIIENARLYEETKRQAEEMTSVYNIGVATTSTLNVDEVLNLVSEQVSRLMEVSSCYIALYDAEREELHFELALDEGVPLAKFARKLADGAGLSGWIVQSKQPLLIRDSEKDEFPVGAIVVGLPARSWLGVPLLYRDKLVGVMGVQSYQPNAFDEEDQQLLSTIAAQVAIAIENARLHEGTTRRLRELLTLYESSQTIGQLLPVDEFANKIIAVMEGLLDYEYGAILLIDEQTSELVPFALSDQGHGPDSLERDRDYICSYGVKVGEGVTGWVAQTGETVRSGDVRREPRYLAVRPDVRSELCVPLRIGERIIGVINIETTQLDAYTEHDERLLGTLAGQIAVVIENTRLFAETERKANDLVLLLGTSTAISSSLDLDQILKTVTRQIVASLVATFCRITLLDETGKNLFIRAVYPIREQVGEDDFDRQCPLAVVPWHKWVIETGESVVLRQDVPESALSDEECKLVLTAGVQSAALIPLIVGGRVLGVISLGEERSWERSPFTPEKVELCQSIAAQAAVAIENAHLYEELQQSFLQTISALAAAVDAKDAYTGGHSQRTTELAASIAQKLGLSDQETELIRYAGLLHDVGKIGISEQILSKPGPLGVEEWEVVRSHPTLGVHIVERAALLQKLVPIILHHHERYDGQGYPEGLMGEDIPLKARILAVADAYEAMTSDRAYRPAMTVEQALATLRQGADEQWDGKVVEVLHGIIREQGHRDSESTSVKSTR